MASCIQCQHSSSSEPLINGWKSLTREYVQRCRSCYSPYEAGQFCEAFHAEEDGWKDCKSCGMLLHCGCQVSLGEYTLDDFGGMTCVESTENMQRMGRNRGAKRGRGRGYTTAKRVRNLLDDNNDDNDAPKRTNKSKPRKQKTKSVSEEAKKRVAETDDSEKDDDEHEDVKGASEDGKSEDVSSEEEHVSKPESEEESSKKGKRSSTKSKSSKNESPKEKKKVVKSSTSDSKAANQSDSGTKTFSRKNKKKDAVEDKPVTPKKPAPEEKSGNEKGKPKSEKRKVSDDDLRTAICEILEEVDLNTTTSIHIIKHLAKRFNTDLTSRKSSIKFMIMEELNKLGDETEEEDEEEPEKTGKQASGQGCHFFWYKYVT